MMSESVGRTLSGGGGGSAPSRGRPPVTMAAIVASMSQRDRLRVCLMPWSSSSRSSVRGSEVRNMRKARHSPWIRARAVSTCVVRGTTLPAESRTTNDACAVRECLVTGTHTESGESAPGSVRSAHFWSAVSTFMLMSMLTVRAMCVESASVSVSLIRSTCSSRSPSARRFSPSASS
jgi:hypothetical protein